MICFFLSFHDFSNFLSYWQNLISSNTILPVIDQSSTTNKFITTSCDKQESSPWKFIYLCLLSSNNFGLKSIQYFLSQPPYYHGEITVIRFDSFFCPHLQSWYEIPCTSWTVTTSVEITRMKLMSLYNDIFFETATLSNDEGKMPNLPHRWTRA